jgi:hypothetical protein
MTTDHMSTHRRRVGLIVAVSGLAAVALTVGTFAVAQAVRPQTALSVLCFEHASTSSGYTTAAMGSATNAPTGQIDHRGDADPVAVCASAWRVGQVDRKVDSGRDQKTAQFPVPQLVACTMANGVGAAFPREGSHATAARFCDSLGLIVWSK